MISDDYPEVPGHVTGSTTSEAAGKRMRKHAPGMADRCEAWFREETRRGRYRTCEDCEIAAKAAGALGKHQSISARIRTDLFIKRRCLFKFATVEETGEPFLFWYHHELNPPNHLMRTKKGDVIFRTKKARNGKDDLWLYGWGYDPSRITADSSGK